MPGFTIDGINSGIDTAAYINAIIEFERGPAVLMEVEQAEKTNIVSTLKALQAKVLALKAQAAQLVRADTFDKSTVTVSDSEVLTATAKDRTGTGSYDIQVLSLARNHQLASQGISDESTSSFGTGTITIGLGSDSVKTITIDSNNNSLVGIKTAINNADAGVSASIINDGSGTNAYRMVLTADKAGIRNKINITSSLTGGTNLNYSTASFDAPEPVSMDSGSDSTISLGASAAYTGNANSIFTFTVAGTGSQTVGTDNITIDWTDGTNSGQIVVTQADFEYDLDADGLKLSFSSGELNAGDIFQVQSFAPLLQEAADARVAIGSSGGTGSPITVTSESNTMDDVIAGVSLELKKETGSGEHVTINTDIDAEGIKAAIQAFVSAYNDINDFIDEQNSYNEETKESGILLGDYIIQTMQYSIRSALSAPVDGLTSEFSSLAALGIRSNSDGRLLVKDSGKFDEGIRENLDDIVKLFADSGTSSSNYIEFFSAASDAKMGEDYEVDITQAATQGYFRGSAFTDLSVIPLTLNSSNNRLKLSVNNVESNELILSEKTYNSTNELVQEIQTKIDGDAKIGSRGLTVEWIDNGDGTGYLNLFSSTYGSGSKVEMTTGVPSSAFAVLGLAGGASIEGTDVAGTINGEQAEGSGQYLTGKEGNPTTDGLKLRVTLASNQLVSGAEGTITLSRGVASNTNALLDSLTKSSDGLIDRRIKSYQNQIDNLSERVAAFDERLTLRRVRLQMQFQKMEEILGQLQAQSNYLTAQLANVNSNWKIGGKSAS